MGQENQMQHHVPGSQVPGTQSDSTRTKLPCPALSAPEHISFADFINLVERTETRNATHDNRCG